MFTFEQLVEAKQDRTSVFLTVTENVPPEGIQIVIRKGDVSTRFMGVLKQKGETITIACQSDWREELGEVTIFLKPLNDGGEEVEKTFTPLG